MTGRGRRQNGRPAPEPVPDNFQPEHISFADIVSVVGNLNGDDNKNTARWFDSFEEFTALARLSDIQKYIYCRRLLKGSVKSVIDTLNGITTFQELKGIIIEEFGGEVNAAQVHRLLKHRKKSVNETSKQYYIAMKELGVGVDPELIVQYVIEGINDDEINKVMLYGVKPGTQFNEKLELYDLIKRKKGELAAGTTMKENSFRPNYRFEPYPKREFHSKKRCYR